MNNIFGKFSRSTILRSIVTMILSSSLIYYLSPELSLFSISTYSLIFILVLASFKAMLSGEVLRFFNSHTRFNRILIHVFHFIFVLFLFLSLLGSRLKDEPSLLKNLLLSLLVFSSLLCIVYFITGLLLSYKQKQSISAKTPKIKILIYALPSLFIFSLYFIAFYPGAMSPDSLDQWSQVLSRKFNDWHPVMHTWFIMSTTYFWKSPAAFSIAQIIILSVSIGYLGYNFEKYGVNKYFTWLSVIFLSVIPVNGIYSITMWKDILFSVSVFLFTILLFNIIVTKGKWLDSKLNSLFFFFSSFGVVMFRHNGLAVFVVSVVVLAIILRKQFKKACILSALVIVANLIITGPIYDLCKVTPSDPNEALAIPTQQIASIIAQDGNLSKEQRDFFNEIMPLDTWREMYNPYSVDPIKFHEKYNKSFLLQHKSEFIKQWLKLCVKNPNLAIKAYLKQTSVVWQIRQFRDGVSSLFLTGIYPVEIGQQMGISSKVINENITERITAILDVTWKQPFIVMWRPAAYSFLIIFFCFINILKRKWRYSLISVPILLNIMIMLVAIPAQDFRYLYANLLVMVVLFLSTFVNNEVNNME